MNPRPKRLTPAMFQILVAVGAGEKHGYAIMQDLDSLGGPQMGPGTLYRSIKLLLDQGFLEETERPAEDDPRRRYYRVTDSGAAVVAAEADRLEKLVGRARSHGLLHRGPTAPETG